MVVTTHSSHILYESNFKPIRYFCRAKQAATVHCSSVKNLSTFYNGEAAETRDFLLKYLKLTHCDLFFADAAILVEGNVERLLLPLIIERDFSELRACHLTILEVGGAFAHKFQKLIEFLGITTLVITDLDSVEPRQVASEEHSDGEDEPESSRGKACLTSVDGAVTSNETLKQWLPKCAAVADLLNLGDSEKIIPGAEGSESNLRVAYQTREAVLWGGVSAELAGRTLEEAFALENLAWSQDLARKALGLRIRGAVNLDVGAMHERLFDRVKNIDKTRFALELIAESSKTWVTPSYIRSGLGWLRSQLQIQSEPPAPGSEPEVMS
jgi:predicted ATP-dependent endonuclease of OLD family